MGEIIMIGLAVTMGSVGIGFGAILVGIAIRIAKDSEEKIND